MKLYHVTTERMARNYHRTGSILAPVRGFDTLLAAMAWAVKTGRKVIYVLEVPEGDELHKLPDHHNAYGKAWWHENNVPMANARCEYSAGLAIPKEPAQ